MILGMFAFAVPLAYWHPFIAADLALVTVLWMVPGFLPPLSRKPLGNIKLSDETAFWG